MNFQKLYDEFSKRMGYDYYIELAQNEILAVPLLIDIMLDEDPSNSRWAESVLEKISEQNPHIVYPYFDYIIRGFEKSNKFVSWNLWKIISNILRCDYDNKWAEVRQKYFDALNSSMISEFSIACECADRIVKSKPEDEEEITKILKNVKNRKFFIAGEVSKSSLEIAIEKSENFFYRNTEESNSVT